MKQWIKRILGKEPDAAPNTDLNALDDYVVVKRKDLDALIAELQDLRNQGVNTDARELDMMVANLEAENKDLKHRVNRLTVFAKECILGAYKESELGDAAKRALQ